MKIKISLSASSPIRFLEKFSDPSAFALCDNNSSFGRLKTMRLLYIKEAMRKINDVLFHGALDLNTVSVSIPFEPPPGLEQSIASWFSKERMYVFSPTPFVHMTELGCLATLVHEMCHQAVTDLTRTKFFPQSAKEHSRLVHGPEWKAWMRRVGMPTTQGDSRYYYKKEFLKSLRNSNKQ